MLRYRSMFLLREYSPSQSTHERAIVEQRTGKIHWRPGYNNVEAQVTVDWLNEREATYARPTAHKQRTGAHSKPRRSKS